MPRRTSRWIAGRASVGTSTVRRPDRSTWIVLGRSGTDCTVAFLDAAGVEQGRGTVAADALPGWVAEREAGEPVRWVWNDTPGWYAGLLTGGTRVARCHDLRLCHAILRDSALVRADADLRGHPDWDAPANTDSAAAPALFELGTAPDAAPALPESLDEALQEFARQRAAVDGASDPGRLRLLTAAESAGALVAVELRAAGLPWDPQAHDRILAEVLGARPAAGRTPAKLEDAGRRVREALGDPAANLDSQPKLLRSLHRAGILVESTSRWELAQYRHPVIEPLLEYKKLSRLLSANGWAWLDEWVHDGRFRPVYVPGGVVTGRWASSGGGALQLPRQLRGAVRADPGWRLVIADVAQLEPRVLAAMAGDRALADAARGKDLYAGIVDAGAVPTRAEAKIAMLGAMYGATTGDSGRLVPRLRRTFPRAMALVDAAAREGENGGVVSTWLGRSCPEPSAGWHAAQSLASDVDASGGDETRARRWARDRGRFTRNFVVQGTAAEWALAWMADVRGRLAALDAVPESDAAPRSGRVFATRPHLAFFLHDEVVVHAPREHADAAARAISEAAESAGRLLFGDFPIDFPLDLRIAETAHGE
ncbi:MULTISPECIES: bifunctional 3'-5' exonuclease/DNA polymerase [unclassified Microbacterium]|uniref:bifunctional 3'-5' exonuclease/DNA polymerase n=1 Tax=unclassified Microbacterium TaxID=2609290 RepID=UPI00214AC6B3|nr:MULTISPECIES: bifunctional 3'-5' exonuclease/DNA polymerase [unclassified Microbacterium]MCR2811172.1 bifunctional 3'-5' exonuclease/DNA polymerase [Microbacterium sp. zg.B185]WIM20715.1 bifunctional 3'-5' exonuclease/DNA polymerase [Microbacterium sp. zg-B185]